MGARTSLKEDVPRSMAFSASLQAVLKPKDLSTRWLQGVCLFAWCEQPVEDGDVIVNGLRYTNLSRTSGKSRQPSDWKYLRLFI